VLKVQMFRLHNRRGLRPQKQKVTAQGRLTTALATGTATEKVRARTALERAQAGLVAAKNADAQAIAERKLAAARS
jgi:hypothetical protein